MAAPPEQPAALVHAAQLSLRAIHIQLSPRAKISKLRFVRLNVCAAGLDRGLDRGVDRGVDKRVDRGWAEGGQGLDRQG